MSERSGPAHAPRRTRVARSGPRALARLVIALAIAGIVTFIVWRHIGTHLSVTTDIVGGTTFANFDSYRYIYRFYDITLVLPAAATIVYLVMYRFGPLRAGPPAHEWPPLLDAEDSGPDHGTAGLAFTSTAATWPVQAMDVVWALARVALVAATAGIEANVGHSAHIDTLTRFGLFVGGLYVVGVGTITLALGLGRRLVWSHVDGMESAANGGWASQFFSLDLPRVNALASVIVIPLLAGVSSTTSVTVSSDGRVIDYPWFPAWLGALLAIIALGLLVRALLRADTPLARKEVERRTLLIVVAPVLMFMLSASLIGAQGPFNGFDDAQAMVGAKLTFWQGLWPWSDLYLLHGFFSDALYGAVGMWVLSPTVWGSNAGQVLLVLPFTIVTLYAFIVYFARKNMLLVVGGTLALLLGLLQGWWGTRYVLLPVVLILFDRVLRRGTWIRCLLFMISVVFLSIVTPEATLLMIGVLATLVIAELVHRQRRQALRESFTRTLRCVATGAACIGVWTVFLAATGTLSGFVAYYRTAATGHELWGAFSPQWTLTGNPWATIEFGLPILLFLLTVGKVVTKLVRRDPWRPIEWVLVASSTPVLLFYQVVLDRMDYGHVMEVFQTLVPFVLLWAIEILRFADSNVARAWACFARKWSPATRVRFAVPVTVLAVVAIAVGSPSSATSWKQIPAAFHPVVPADAPKALPLGYTQPGAVDVAQVLDLGKVLDRYAGKNAPVFDFVNEMGVPYFLLGRVPGVRFYHVESAQTAYAQGLEVSDLQRSRPPVVIFNDVTFGLPNYDGIWSMERNYIVSQYILDHYRPLLDTHGQLILLRNDLMKAATPLPKLSEPPITTNLYFDASVPSCYWGDVPNFLDHPSSNAIRGSLTVPVSLGDITRTLSIQGWAFDVVSNQPAVSVLAVSSGHVVGQFPTHLGRPDVAAALDRPSAANSGFEGQVSIPGGGSLQLYALNGDGTVSPLSGQEDVTGSSQSVSDITTPDGVLHPVRPVAAEGHVDAASEATVHTYTLTIPAGADLAAYKWMVVGSAEPLDSSQFVVTDSFAGGASHAISWNTLPRTGNEVFTRVGSCLQWHGYDTTTLTMLASGPARSLSVHLLK